MRTGKINPISISGFWLLLFVSVGTLALGAFASLWPLGETTKERLTEIHISLGLTSGILLVLQLLLISFSAAFGAGDREADGKRRPAAKLLRGVLYLLILALIATGLAGAYYRGDTLSFWGYPLAAWEYVDLSTSDLLQAVHRDAGYALAAFLGVYVALALANLLWPASPPPSQGEFTTVHAAGQSDQIGRLIADGLSQNFDSSAPPFFGPSFVSASHPACCSPSAMSAIL